MSNIYYCTNENNICPKKETCKRYVEVEGKNHATLFKVACTEDNNYVLFMKYKEVQESQEIQDTQDNEETVKDGDAE